MTTTRGLLARRLQLNWFFNKHNALKWHAHRQDLKRDPTESRTIFYCNMLVTFRCNLRCLHCYEWGESGFCHDGGLPGLDPELNLPIEIAQKYIEGLKPYRPNFMAVAGGEPLMYPHLFEVARRAREIGCVLGLETNAILLPDKVEKVASHFDRIHISVDGDEQGHNAVRRHGGSFNAYEMTIAGIQALEAHRAKRRTARPTIEVVLVIQPANYERLAEAVFDLKRRCPSVDSIVLSQRHYLSAEQVEATNEIFTREFGAPNQVWGGFVHDPSRMNLRKLKDQLKALEGEARVMLPNMATDDVVRWYEDRTYVPKGTTFCHAPWMQLTLMPNGDVHTCPGFVAGNLHEQDLDEIWNGELARKNRRHIYENGLFPACRACGFLLSCGSKSRESSLLDFREIASM